MIADEEWNTPHWSPDGGSVALWVEGVRWYERNGWLRDPREFALPPGTDPITLRNHAFRYELCHSLCWRPRCRRARRCRHRMPLAIREWMPEFAVVLAELRNQPLDYHGPTDPVKKAELKRLLGIRE